MSVSLMRSKPDTIAAPTIYEGLPLIIQHDDGSAVTFSGCAGGAHPDGAWSHVTLAFFDAAGKQTLVHYRREEESNSCPEAV